MTVRPGGRVPNGAPVQGAQISSTRIGDLGADRGMRSQGPKKEKKGMGGIIVAFILSLLLAAAVGGFALYNSSVFEITQLSVKGAEHLTSAEVNQLAGIPEGQTLLRVDTDAIKNRMLMDTWVEDVHVNRLFPSTLEIVVKERTIKAVVEISSKGSGVVKEWAIASDGMWLMPIPDRNSEAGQATSQKVYEDADAALHIEGVPYTASAEIGKYCSDSNVNNALNIVAGMTTELAQKVRTVVASDPDSTTLILDNGIEVAFGNSQDIRAKERVCLELMKRYEGSVAYINVRTVDRPTWRSL